MSLHVVTAGVSKFSSSLRAGNTKGGSITVPLVSSLTGLDSSVLQIKTKIVSSHKADSKPVKQEVNGTMILPPLVFLAQRFLYFSFSCYCDHLFCGKKETVFFISVNRLRHVPYSQVKVELAWDKHSSLLCPSVSDKIIIV